MERSGYQTLIDTIQPGSPNTATEMLAILNAFADALAQTGDVKEVHVSTGYIAANFDVTGLGINERVGWAICNGNNGTLPKGGRVSIGYDPANYPTLGATGGSKDAVVVSHNHDSIEYSTGVLAGNTTGLGASGSRYNLTGATATVNSNKTSTDGVSGTDKNMQPYLVALFIMKL